MLEWNEMKINRNWNDIWKIWWSMAWLPLVRRILCMCIVYASYWLWICMICICIRENRRKNTLKTRKQPNWWNEYGKRNDRAADCAWIQSKGWQCERYCWCDNFILYRHNKYQSVSNTQQTVCLYAYTQTALHKRAKSLTGEWGRRE